MTAEHVAIQNYACPHCRAVFRTAFQRCPLDGNPLQELIGDPLSGASFADRYIIEECVGEGGMGRVYRARHQRMSRRFAVKVLFGDHAADSKMQARLAREAEAASRLSHPNVISVVDFGETDQGLLYLVMDYVEGPTLAQVIEREAPISRERVIRIARDCARGLAHAHNKGLIHRDFKADNVLITQDSGEEVAKIVDFGIAMLNEPSKSRKLTTEGMVLGTPAVMAPEQAVGEKVDHRTDLFSLGIVMYEMMAGVLPFDGSPLEIARQNLASLVPKISNRVPGLYVDPELEALSVALMAKRPEDRPQRAKDVLKALSRIEGESSREFRRAEALLLETDPLTPIPGMTPVPGRAQSDSWSPEESSGDVYPVQPMHMDPSQPHHVGAAGLTELAQPRIRRRGLSASVLIAVGAAVLVLTIMIVVLSSSSGTPEASVVADAGPEVAEAVITADAVEPLVTPVPDAGEGIIEPPPTPDAAPEVVKALTPREKRALERKRKAAAERDRKRKAALAERERKRKEAERENKRKEAAAAKAAADAKKELSMKTFNARFSSVGSKLNELSAVDPAAARAMLNRYTIIQNQLQLARQSLKLREQNYRSLGALSARASAALKAAKTKNKKKD